MDTMQVEAKDEIEISEDRAMLYIPHNALEGELTFKIYLDGEIRTVMKKLDQDELREAVRKAENGYIDEDDRFCLTDFGRQHAEELLHTGCSPCDPHAF